jgi:hypothetical protein
MRSEYPRMRQLGLSRRRFNIDTFTVAIAIENVLKVRKGHGRACLRISRVRRNGGSRGYRLLLRLR